MRPSDELLLPLQALYMHVNAWQHDISPLFINRACLQLPRIVLVMGVMYSQHRFLQAVLMIDMFQHDKSPSKQEVKTIGCSST